MSMLSSARVAVVLGLVAAVHAGCTGPCQKVARARAAALVRPAPATGPHLRARVPFAVASGLVAELLAARPPIPLLDPDSVPGPLRGVVGDLAIVVRDVRFGAAPPGHVHVEVEAEVQIGGVELLTASAGADLAATVEQDGDEVALSIGLSPDVARELERRLAAGLVELGDPLLGWLSDRVRLPRVVLDPLAERVLELALARLGDRLLPSLLDLLRVRIELPPIPVTSIALTSTADALELGVVTSLPVRTAAAEPSSPPGSFGLAVSGSALAELATWAVTSGPAPRRYERSLEPDADGDFVPRFDWRDDHPRPLVVHVDRVADGCEWFTVGVTPSLALRGDKVVAGASERTFEEVLGPAHIHVAAWLKELLQGAVSRKAVASVAVTVAGRRVEAHLVDVALDGRGLRAAATLALAPP